MMSVSYQQLDACWDPCFHQLHVHDLAASPSEPQELNREVDYNHQSHSKKGFKSQTKHNKYQHMIVNLLNYTHSRLNPDIIQILATQTN